MEDTTQPVQLSSHDDNENENRYSSSLLSSSSSSFSSAIMDENSSSSSTNNNTPHDINNNNETNPSAVLESSTSLSSSAFDTVAPPDLSSSSSMDTGTDTPSSSRSYLAIRRSQHANYKMPPTLVKNLEHVSSAALTEAAEKVRKEQEKAKARAERFNLPYVEPDIRQLNILTKTEYMRLISQSKPGEVTGFDPTAAAEQEKRTARAARFGTTVFSYDKERLLSAGFTEDAINLRQTFRDRAAKYKQASAIDIAIAKAAVAALGAASESTEEAVRMSSMEDTDGTIVASSTVSSFVKEEAIVRPDALHMRAYEYIPASDEDIRAFCSPLRPAYIEWLNGSSLNIIFEDTGTASRAIELLSEPIPIVPDVPPVLDSWRFCPKPLIKQKSNQYAPAGAETTVYLRFATNLDTKERAPRTRGARSQGTFSKHGLFSQRAVNAELMRREILQEQITEGQLNPDTVIKSLATGPSDVSTAVHIASRIGHALTSTATHLKQKLNPDTMMTEESMNTERDDNENSSTNNNSNKNISNNRKNSTLQITVDVSRSGNDNQPIKDGFIVKRNGRSRVIVRASLDKASPNTQKNTGSSSSKGTALTSTASPSEGNTVTSSSSSSSSAGGGKRTRANEEEYANDMDKLNLFIKEEENNLRTEAAISDEQEFQRINEEFERLNGEINPNNDNNNTSVSSSTLVTNASSTLTSASNTVL